MIFNKVNMNNNNDKNKKINHNIKLNDFKTTKD